MAWQVVMDVDGSITLPPELLLQLGWTPETPLRWTGDESGIRLGPAETGSRVDRSSQTA